MCVVMLLPVGLRTCAINGPVRWWVLVLVFCERKTLLASWFGLAKTNK